jgi:RNA polymerase sigma factor (sigma-70 family)
MPDTPPTLLIRLRDPGDQGSWRQFYEQYWRLIYTFARRCGLPESDAQDTVQDVVTEVFRAMPRFEYDRARGSFRNYLRTITARKIIDRRRHDAARPTVAVPITSHDGQPVLADPDSPTGAEVWERDWRRNLLQVCIDRVAHEVEPRTFQAFQLCAVEGWSGQQAAEFLEMTTEAVWQAKSRVARGIREWFLREVGED